MAQSAFEEHRRDLATTGFQFLAGYLLRSSEGFTEVDRDSAVDFMIDRILNDAHSITLAAEVREDAKAMVEKLKIHTRTEQAEYLDECFDRMFTPEVTEMMQTEYAEDVPFAVVRMLMELSHRPIDVPPDVPQHFKKQKSTEAQQREAETEAHLMAAAETSSSSYQSTLSSEEEWSSSESPRPGDNHDEKEDEGILLMPTGSVSKNSPSAGDENSEGMENDMCSASIRPEQRRRRCSSHLDIDLSPRDVFFDPDPLPLPDFFHKIKNGRHADVPERFIIEDTIGLLLGLDSSISTISASTETLAMESVSDVLTSFKDYARLLNELRGFTETLRLVLPPIEDQDTCLKVTELYDNGRLRMDTIGSCSQALGCGECASYDGHRSVETIFGLCWHGVQLGLEDLLRDFDALLYEFETSLDGHTRTLSALRQHIRPSMRVVSRFHRLLRDVFESEYTDGEDLRLNLISMVTEHIHTCPKQMIPFWTKILTPVYDAMASYHAFHEHGPKEEKWASFYPFPVPDRNYLDGTPLGASCGETGEGRKLESGSMVLKNLLLERAGTEAPRSYVLARAALPMYRMDMNASKAHAARGLAIPDGPTRVALASLHGVALAWNPQVLDSMVKRMHCMSLDTALRKSIDIGINYVEANKVQNLVLQVPAIKFLTCAKKNLTISKNYELQWIGDPMPILDHETIKAYSRIFHLLVHLRWTQKCVPRCKNINEANNRNEYGLYAEMRHFLVCLRQYIGFSIEAAANTFQSKLEQVQTRGITQEDLTIAHADFIHDTLQGCLLHDEFRSVSENIFSIMELIRTFAAASLDEQRGVAFDEDYRIRVTCLLQALKWSVATRGLESSERVLLLVQTVNYNHFYGDTESLPRTMRRRKSSSQFFSPNIRRSNASSN